MVGVEVADDAGVVVLRAAPAAPGAAARGEPHRDTRRERDQPEGPGGSTHGMSFRGDRTRKPDSSYQVFATASRRRTPGARGPAGVETVRISAANSSSLSSTSPTTSVTPAPTSAKSRIANPSTM